MSPLNESMRKVQDMLEGSTGDAGGGDWGQGGLGSLLRLLMEPLSNPACATGGQKRAAQNPSSLPQWRREVELMQ